MEKELAFAWQSGLFLIICLGLFFIAKLIFKMFNPKINLGSELVDKDNTAFYIVYICYFLGFLLIVGGIMNSESSGHFLQEITYTLAYGLVGVFLLNIITIIMDRFVHTSLKLWDEVIEKTNIAIGVLKGGNYLSAGIIISGVMLTEVDRPIQAAVFLVFALVIASIGFVYYNLTTPFNAKTEIYKGNIAVAISAAGAQVAFAILIYAGFQIEHTSWVDSLISIGIDVLGGIIILPLIRLIVEKAFISKHRKITDEMINQDVPNVGLGMFEAGAYIGGALLFIWCWNL
ncbi:DUF350 domain-containing protein [Crocinitomix catalasitica]|uniref:DUF350 domain-containing protein n=1 Tax=Crocinitomix catalasitica TaxID=184607 RepID=UPI000481B05E|nr:DUF350 domain-containing protein [Crocinitomix catalasitica]